MTVVRVCEFEECKSDNIELQSTRRLASEILLETFYCNACGAKFFIESRLIDLWKHDDNIFEKITENSLLPNFLDIRGPKFQKSLKAINRIIDKKNQSVSAVIQLLVIESFGAKKDSEIAFEILSPLKEKHNFA
jgi:hypothetical protein